IGWNGPLGNLNAADFRHIYLGAAKPMFMAGRDEAAYANLVEEAFKQAAEDRVYTKVNCVTGQVEK
ncbi:hypothetical protein HK405_009185, partial [Cladochytrium tenue]